MDLQLLAVHSRLADTIPSDMLLLLPNQFTLSQHQVDTFNALSDPTIDIVINTAMTGDGKSLAGQLPTLVHGHHAIACYPTNELIQAEHPAPISTRR